MTVWGSRGPRGGRPPAARAGQLGAGSRTQTQLSPGRGPPPPHWSGFRSCRKARRLTDQCSLTTSFAGMHRKPQNKGELCGAEVWEKDSGHGGGSRWACHCWVGPAPPAPRRSAQARGASPGLSRERGLLPSPVLCARIGSPPKGPVLGSPQGDRLAHLLTPTALCSQFKRPRGPLCRALGSCPQLRQAPQPCPSLCALPVTAFACRDLFELYRHPLWRLTEVNWPLRGPAAPGSMQYMKEGPYGAAASSGDSSLASMLAEDPHS